MGLKEQFVELFENRMGADEARELLISLYKQGETSSDIAAAASVMRQFSIKVPLEESLRNRAVDIVGTGGDKSGTFNVSTTTSLLLSATGAIVAKHGNRSITSKSGSADLLERLGYNLCLDAKGHERMLEEVGFCFFFAMEHHPAMKHIMPIRKSIEHRTIFNLLGPLTNPASINRYLLGVFSPDFVEPVAGALLELDVKRAYVVSALDNTDEIVLNGPTKIAYIDANKVSYDEIVPENYGIKSAPKEAVLGGDAQKNAAITQAIFDNSASDACRDIVRLNSAFALHANAQARDIQEGLEIATEAIESGRAKAHLQKIITLSQSL